MKNVIGLLVIISAFSLMLCGCSRIRYADGVGCEEIGEGIRETVGEERELASFGAEELEREIDVDGMYDDFYSLYSVDVNDIDEVCIFHAPTARDAKELAEECREYIDGKRDEERAFIAGYAPMEVSKLDGAQVRRFGNYVVYTVLDSDTADAVYESIKLNLAR